MQPSASHSHDAVPLAVADNAVDKCRFELQQPAAIEVDNALAWLRPYGFGCSTAVAPAALVEPVALAACVDKEQVRCFDDLALDN